MDLDFKKPCTFTLSANEIRQYGECPRKRYYSSRDCLALRTNTINKNLELGKAVHSSFQYYYTELSKKLEEIGNEHPTVEDVESLIDTIPVYDIYTEDVVLTEDDEKILKCILENYMHIIFEDLTMYKVIACEANFNMNDWPTNDAMYHGLIDMIVLGRDDDKYYFFEHKTCTNFRPEIYDRFDVQLHIYDAYGYETYGSQFGGMILNQVKKAKTERGFGHDRKVFIYTDNERVNFYHWLKKKTEGLMSPENIHEPCNNYMSCKMCEYSDICLKYGYSIPQTSNEVIDSFINEEGKPQFNYDPRETEEEN